MGEYYLMHLSHLILLVIFVREEIKENSVVTRARVWRKQIYYLCRAVMVKETIRFIFGFVSACVRACILCMFSCSSALHANSARRRNPAETDCTDVSAVSA